MMKGFSIIEVLIAAAIMAGIMLVLVQMQTYQTQAVQNAQTMITRNNLQLQLQQNLINAGAITKTLANGSAGNVALKNCLTPSGPSCVATPPTGTGFSLFDPSNTQVSGPTGTPIIYDNMGVKCTTPSSKCFIEVITSFVSTCAPAASPCSNPTVTASYTIQQTTGIFPIGGTSLKTITSAAIPMLVTGGSVAGTPCGPSGYGLTIFSSSGVRYCCITADIAPLIPTSLWCNGYPGSCAVYASGSPLTAPSCTPY